VIAIPCGKYIGKRLASLPNDEAEHFIRVLPAAAGSIAET
jgi:hypothetical protein